MGRTLYYSSVSLYAEYQPTFHLGAGGECQPSNALDGADSKLEPCIRLTCVDSFRLQSFISDSVSSSQFNKWLRDSKSRVLDIFRRMDHDRDGKLTREQFITGILNTSKRDIPF